MEKLRFYKIHFCGMKRRKLLSIDIGTDLVAQVSASKSEQKYSGLTEPVP
jgi:hypothetical protein